MKKKQLTRSAIMTFAGFTAGLLTGLFFFWATSPPSEPLTCLPENGDLQRSVTDIFETVSPSVVGIEAINGLNVSTGSGFIVSERGHILTNRHVVDDVESHYSVILNNGRRFRVASIKFHPLYDAALLTIADASGETPSSMPALSTSDFFEAETGEQVLAIANDPSDRTNIIQSGYVSATKKAIGADEIGEDADFIDLIQTDIALQPGSSGGPLLNLSGQVIGINTALTTTAGRISYAVPIDQIKDLLKF